MGKLKKQLMAVQKKGQGIYAVFTETLANAEAHQKELEAIETSIKKELNSLAGLLQDTQQEVKTADRVIANIKKILGEN